MNFKIVISDPKTRKAYQKEIDQKISGLLGKKIGDKVSGTPFGLTGYELEITGGSDKDGFPMRRDVEGTARKRIILSSGPGFRPKKKGQRKRKSVRGNTISSEIVQVNLKIVGYGQKPIEELLGIKKKEPEKEKKAPAEEKTEKKITEEEKKEQTHEEKAEEQKETGKEKAEEEKQEEKKETKKEEKPREEQKSEKPKQEEKKEQETSPQEEKPKQEPKEEKEKI